MARRKRWVAGEVERLGRYLEEGRTDRGIAMRMRRTLRSIQLARCKYFPKPPQPKKPRVWTYERDMRLMDLWRAGWSNKEIAEDMGLSVGTIATRRATLDLTEAKRDRQWQAVDLVYLKEHGAYEDMTYMSRYLGRAAGLIRAKLKEVLPSRGVYLTEKGFVVFKERLECPVCLRQHQIKRPPGGAAIRIECPRCGAVSYAAWRRWRWHVARKEDIL